MSKSKNLWINDSHSVLTLLFVWICSEFRKNRGGIGEAVCKLVGFCETDHHSWNCLKEGALGLVGSFQPQEGDGKVILLIGLLILLTFGAQFLCPLLVFNPSLQLIEECNFTIECFLKATYDNYICFIFHDLNLLKHNYPWSFVHNHWNMPEFFCFPGHPQFHKH